jgi:Ca2+-binding RTX toxin-like protein
MIVGRLIVTAATTVLVLGGGRAVAEPPTTCFVHDITDNAATDGNDYLSGTADADVIALSFGDDQYFAGAGPDWVCGNDGTDLIVGEDGGDHIDGGAGDDLLVGMAGDDTLRGSTGADEIRGNAGDDYLRSGLGDGVRDDLYDGLGNDTVLGDSEDVLHRCADNVGDNFSAFDGVIVPDPDCGA